MAELKIYLSKDLNERFRRIAMSIYGYGRGSISKAAEEALAKWCTGREQSRGDISESSSLPPQPTRTTNVEAGINPDERVSDSESPSTNENTKNDSVIKNSS